MWLSLYYVLSRVLWGNWESLIYRYISVKPTYNFRKNLIEKWEIDFTIATTILVPIAFVEALVCIGLFLAKSISLQVASQGQPCTIGWLKRVTWENQKLITNNKWEILGAFLVTEDKYVHLIATSMTWSTFIQRIKTSSEKAQPYQWLLLILKNQVTTIYQDIEGWSGDTYEDPRNLSLGEIQLM